MLDSHWENLKEIFHGALKLPPDVRPTYLDKACGGNERLRRSVESLLASHEEGDNFMDRPAFQAAADMLADGFELKPDQIVGHYRIVYLLGEGGMGRVYLAEDTKLHRKVSLKFLSQSLMEDTQRLRRFELEARAASALNHPNILTIHEISEADGRRFIATEFIEGQTLRERLRSGLEIDDALDIAIQIASALVAAHRVNIVHRDIKPENIMMRADDGLVKVLDFGLAKITQTKPTDGRADSRAATALMNTGPGVVMGTVAYMSPEQARGDTVDERTDIWSLGVVLYEMVARATPFAAASSNEIISAILSRKPVPPLARFAHDVPERLQEIIDKALTKDRDERYQSSKDLLIDLKRLKQSLELKASIDRSSPPDPARVDSQGRRTVSGHAPIPTVHPTSSAEYIVNQVKSHKRIAIAALGLLLLAIALPSLWYFKHLRAAPILTDKDTILLADFDNKTGDEVFDGTLKQGLAVQLGQSPFLSIFPEANVRQTLKLMSRSPDDHVTADVAREICERQGVKAFITGSIASLGSHYVLTLEAVNGHSGEVLTREQAEAEGKEQVLKALSQAATKMREKLGESLNSIQRFDKPLEVTTSSLEALRAYSLGLAQRNKGGYREAIPFIKRAIELDPNFAAAYQELAIMYANTDQPSRAAEYATQAYALRAKVSERERLRLTATYYAFVTHELDKRIETLEVLKRTYPRDFAYPLNLSAVYAWIGQHEKSAGEAREAIELNRNNAVPWFNLAYALVRLNRFDEAQDVIQQSLERQFDNADFRGFLYKIFFIRGDAAGMQQQLDWAKGRPDEYVALDWQTGAAGFAGQWRRAQDFSRRSVDLAARSDTKEVAARYAAETATREAVFGQCAQAKASAARSVALTPKESSPDRAALALALCGAVAQAQQLMDERAKQYPKDTLLNGLWLPTIRAAIELQQGNALQAVELLQTAARYEPAAAFWPQYLRAQAYLRLNQGAEAATEFQKILDHRGEGPLSPLYPLTHVGLARAAALTGDAVKSRKAYEQFFALWKDADADVPVLIDARKEYERLK